MTRPADYVDRSLAGEIIYGDDFTPEEVAAWFADEGRAYAALGWDKRTNLSDDSYVYHELNRAHGFRYLPSGPFGLTVGLGAAYGDELLPIVDRLKRVVIVEAASGPRRTALTGVPVEYSDPGKDGEIPCEAGTVDLLTCFGVLHHIPTVSRALKEVARVLRPGGYAVVREPIVSMGDWRRPRPGVTPHERGIPLHLLRAAVDAAGLRREHEALCVTPFPGRLSPRWSRSRLLVALDGVAARLLAWNLRYHRKKVWEKFAPACVALVLRKPIT